MLPLRVQFSHGDIENDRLAFGGEGALAGGKCHESQLQSLHGRIDAPQTMAANQNFARDEDQPELLLPSLGLQFGKNEITVREPQGLI